MRRLTYQQAMYLLGKVLLELVMVDESYFDCIEEPYCHDVDSAPARLATRIANSNTRIQPKPQRWYVERYRG